MKPTVQEITDSARAFGEKNIPAEFQEEVLPILIDVCVTALNTEKACSKALVKRKGEMRIEMRAELSRTPHTTLKDSIRLEFYVISNNSNVLLP